MPLPKRAAAAGAAAPAVNLEPISFGSLDDYSSGGILPDGDYFASDHTVVMHQLEKKDGTKVGAPGLFMRVTFEPPTGAVKEDDKHLQYYSMGRQAHESFAPNPQTGKGLVAKAGGKGGNLNEQSNWGLYLKSLYDSGLPEGLFVNDCSVLDGMQIHISNIPEPDSRKNMKQLSTSEVEVARQAKTIAVVTEIKEPYPWAAEAAQPAPVKAAAKPALVKKATPAAKPAVAAAPVAEQAPEGDADEALVQAFSGAVGGVLEANQKGMARMQLRTAVFRTLKAEVGEEQASVLIDAYFSDDAALTAVLNEMGFNLIGTNIAPLA